MRRFLTLIFIFVAALVPAAFAQDNGSITGTVTDPSGGGVPDASVSVRNTDLNALVRTAKTDHNGNYSAPLLQIDR